MPSPRKAPTSHATEAEMPSRKKEVAAPSKSLGKTQGQKGAQVTQRSKANPKGEWLAPTPSAGAPCRHHARPGLDPVASVEFVN
jgi:hypothetical protein